MSQYRLMAEWEPQAAVMLSWPHEATDWQPLLHSVYQVYAELAWHICRYSRLLIAAPASSHNTIAELLAKRGVPHDVVRLYDVDSDDTWARDHGPITVASDAGFKLLDFQFNGWGGKFDASLDNAISGALARAGAFMAPLETIDFVLEGGAIESDGEGTLMATRECLLNSNRNGAVNQTDVEQVLQRYFGVSTINWLSSGFLQGDDTDSHIDTLARLCPSNRILYVGCPDPEDVHHQALAKMKAELHEFRSASGAAYELYELPWPEPVYSADGERLPATYANFLILNGAVLVPTYQDPSDALALRTVAEAFPGYDVVGIDCRVLIEQHGSLHCITMQLPEGVVV
ncbi:agmatine deiminase family protein [Gilvimarinus agarilyticus]|uniref:agmatine deiminase family protein n=1 Tax=Gilvimarinus agarilyticus TaxID=679259 RepID=UPI00059F4695|nr:agmatine deiminase family protein [Gilvimarinus agarilyticus]